MNHEIFFEKFELLADVPNGVQKLRVLILQLAVQGKLVPQDKNDDPAAVLLEKIKRTDRKIENSLSRINKDDYLYELPKLWECVCLGDILTLEYGKNLPKSKRNQSGKYPVYGSNGIVGYHDKFLTDKPGIIVGRKGSAGALNISSEPSWTTDVSYFINPPDGINLNFAFILLKSLNLETLGKGIKPGLNRNEVYLLIVPIPPLEEQKRIVAKVDQLMALCNQLEARQQKKHEQRIRLNNAALDKLLTAPTSEEFAQHWQRICDNFDLLYDAPETVGQLRQGILQLAVQGKLVAQDEGDEPAAVLLEEIKNEKEQLIKDKKISRVKQFPPIKENEISYKLPDKWMWVRLGDALLKITDGTHHSPPNGPRGDFKYITAKNIKSEGINLSNITYVSAKMHEEIYSRCDPEPGNILYIKDGATTGIVTINDLNEQFSMLSSVALLKNPSKIYNRYLLYVLKSPYFYSLIRDDMSGVAITRVTLTNLNSELIGNMSNTNIL